MTPSSLSLDQPTCDILTIQIITATDDRMTTCICDQSTLNEIKDLMKNKGFHEENTGDLYSNEQDMTLRLNVETLALKPPSSETISQVIEDLIEELLEKDA